MLYRRGEIAWCIFLCALAFFALAPSATAKSIGVTPAFYEINFEPYLQKTFQFNFWIEGGAGLKIYANGDLADYVALSDNYLENSGLVNVVLSLPKEIEVPGMHRIQIGALETPKGDKEGVGIVGNVLGVIKVFVPYPGKYVETEFSAKDAKYGEVVEFALKILNKGTEEVSTNSYVEIYDSKDKLVKKIELGVNVIEKIGTRDLKARFDTIGQKVGSYKAIGIVEYAGKKVKKEQAFRIGELFIDITGYSKEFIRGKINKFDIEIESLWNDDIENVFAEVLVPDYNIKFFTPSASLGGFQKINLTGYLDTTSIPVEVDSFRASINVYYVGKTTQKIVRLKIKKEIDYVLYGLIGIIALLGLLLIAIIALNIISYKRLKKFKGKAKRKA